MTQAVIVQGCKTDHGGVVMQGRQWDWDGWQRLYGCLSKM